jgi:arylsulfatase A-like enzyme
MHGHSFRAVLEGQAEEHREAVIAGYHEATDRCIRDREWSLVLRPEGEPDELYDLRSDPREHTNLIDERPDIGAGLARRFGPYFFGPDRVSVGLKGIQGKYEMASGSVG